MNNIDKEYLRVLRELYTKSTNKQFKYDRTGTGTVSIFAPQIKFNFNEGFPICTTKNVYFKGIMVELLWFLGNHLKMDRYKDLGITNIRYLLDNNVNIWNEWVFQPYLIDNNLENEFPKYTKEWREEMKSFCSRIQSDDEFAERYGTIGSGYGKQWVDWGGYLDPKPTRNGINQIEKSIDLLKNDPDSRRILVNAWNVTEIDDMKLPPCHYSFQFYTEILNEKDRIDWCVKNDEYSDNLNDKIMDKMGVPKRSISLLWNQRSADYFLGIPFNISSYALLLSMVAQVVNMIPNKLIGNLGDCHLYSNHIEQANEQLSREIKYKLPKLYLNKDIDNISDFTIDDIKLIDYEKDDTIKAPISV